MKHLCKHISKQTIYLGCLYSGVIAHTEGRSEVHRATKPFSTSLPAASQIPVSMSKDTSTVSTPIDSTLQPSTSSINALPPNSNAQTQGSALPPYDEAGSRWSWVPTSEGQLLAAERRLLSLVKTPHVLERVDIGPFPVPTGRERPYLWGGTCGGREASRLINTVTFEQKDPEAPTMVLIHGYGASQGFYWRNFDELAKNFRLVAIDMLGWGASSRPLFHCKTQEEAEAWHVDSLEDWRNKVGIEKMILVAHSFGGYVASLYALKYPDRVQQLILVGPAGWLRVDTMLERIRSTWIGRFVGLAQRNDFTPQWTIRRSGPWGKGVVEGYTKTRFGTKSVGDNLTEEEQGPFTDYLYHTIVAPPSGELCLRHVFTFASNPATPLNDRAAEFKIPITFIYGEQDWMDFLSGVEGCKLMNVPAEVIVVPRGGHFVFLDNAPGFHEAIAIACHSHMKRPLVSQGEAAQDGKQVEVFFRNQASEGRPSA